MMSWCLSPPVIMETLTPEAAWRPLNVLLVTAEIPDSVVPEAPPWCLLNCAKTRVPSGLSYLLRWCSVGFPHPPSCMALELVPGVASVR